MGPSVKAEDSHEQLQPDESRASLQFETVAGRARLEVVLSVICRDREYTLK